MKVSIEFVHARRSVGINVDVQHEQRSLRVPMAQHGGKKIRGYHGRRHHTNGAAQVAGTGGSGGFSVPISLGWPARGPDRRLPFRSTPACAWCAAASACPGAAPGRPPAGSPPGARVPANGRPPQNHPLINNGPGTPAWSKVYPFGQLFISILLIVSFFRMINCRACYFSKGKP